MAVQYMYVLNTTAGYSPFTTPSCPLSFLLVTSRQYLICIGLKRQLWITGRRVTEETSNTGYIIKHVYRLYKSRHLLLFTMFM